MRLVTAGESRTAAITQGARLSGGELVRELGSALGRAPVCRCSSQSSVGAGGCADIPPRTHRPPKVHSYLGLGTSSHRRNSCRVSTTAEGPRATRRRTSATWLV